MASEGHSGKKILSDEVALHGLTCPGHALQENESKRSRAVKRAQDEKKQRELKDQQISGLRNQVSVQETRPC